ncbi:small ubiquitin-related modifier 3-like [Physella acuta]|uniref:small ubiquitin-related modifier 3-like n=1 Tax=Physella acuta TaxID=109671 RepID=UPI0027DB4257|nr:small ubiquitin-related modifier 3-like [Physella acuta]
MEDQPSQIKEHPKESEHINLKVTGQDGSVVHFKIMKNTPLRKLMGAYCNRDGIQTGVVRFRFDGNPINDEDTPAMLKMEDGDSIDVFSTTDGWLLVSNMVEESLTLEWKLNC